MLKSLEECKKLPNVKLLIEIENRETLMRSMPNDLKVMQMQKEIDKIWKLMEKNARK